MAKQKTQASDILLPLERLSRLMRAGEHEAGLNPAQWESLRYLARANRFSNSPGALTKFLGTTKGTISQTLKALERKGLIAKVPRQGEKRSVDLSLTSGGVTLLENDPLTEFSGSVSELKPKTRRRLVKSLRELLTSELLRQDLPSFGICHTCRYFREDGAEDNLRGPHACMLYEAPLSKRETELVCVAHA